MNATQTYSYNGNDVTFQKGNSNVKVNATEMARPFGKRPAKWLELPSTRQFVDTLVAIRKSDRSSFINVINGIGTWFHEDVALEFARWLSPAFAIWCNDRIKEILLNQRACCPLQAPQPVLQVPKVKYRYRTRIVPAAMNPQDRKDLEVVRKFREGQGNNLYRVAQTMLDNHTAYMDLIGDGVDYQDLKRRFHHTHDLVKFLMELNEKA